MRPVRLLMIALLCLIAFPVAAYAQGADELAQALRSNPVYQAPGLDLVDEDVLREELEASSPKVFAVVLPGSEASTSGQAQTRALEIVRALEDPGAVVLVVSAAQKLGAAAGSEAQAQGVRPGTALSAELAGARGGPFNRDTVTAFVLAFQERVALQVSGSSDSGDSGGSGESGGGGGGNLLAVLLLIGVGAAAFAMFSSKRRKDRSNEDLRADVEQLYNRLGSDVSTLAPGDNAVARQAMADAAERYNATGAILATADSPAEFAAARRTAVEGLTAARVARKELGLDPGPDIPPPPGTGPQLDADERVAVGDQVFEGSPSYRPGHQHYYGGGEVGGQMVRGGWYSAPFWEPFLLGSILTGGFGGGLFGGGGFERGYEAGREDASADSEGGDWGDGDSSGGGDWGGGGDSGGGSW